MKRRRDLRVWVGGAVLGGSVVALAGALSGALTSSPAGGPGERPVPTGEAAVQTALAAAEPVATERVTMAVERAPFDPQRRAPRGRYLLPEDMVVEAPPPPPPPLPPAPEFRVLATIGSPGGGVAVIEVEGEPPRVVAVGQEVLGYSLASIGSRSVVVSKEGRDVRVSMVEPTAAVVAAAPTNARGQQNRGGRSSNTSNGNNGLRFQEVPLNFTPLQARPGSPEAEAGSRVQEALERLRERQQGQQGGGGNQGRSNQNRNPPRPPGGG